VEIDCAAQPSIRCAPLHRAFIGQNNIISNSWINRQAAKLLFHVSIAFFVSSQAQITLLEDVVMSISLDSTQAHLLDLCHVVAGVVQEPFARRLQDCLRCV
jgi:hypothetical protein